MHLLQSQAIKPLSAKLATHHAIILINSGLTGSSSPAVYHDNNYIIVELAQALEDPSQIAPLFLNAVLTHKRNALGYSSDSLFEALFNKALYYRLAVNSFSQAPFTLPEITDSVLFQQLAELYNSPLIGQEKWLDGDNETAANIGVAIFNHALNQFVLDYPGSDLFTSSSLRAQELQPYLMQAHNPRAVKNAVSIRTAADGGGDYQQLATDFASAYYLEGFHYRATA